MDQAHTVRISRNDRRMNRYYIGSTKLIGIGYIKLRTPRYNASIKAVSTSRESMSKHYIATEKLSPEDAKKFVNPEFAVEKKRATEQFVRYARDSHINLLDIFYDEPTEMWMHEKFFTMCGLAAALDSIYAKDYPPWHVLLLRDSRDTLVTGDYGDYDRMGFQDEMRKHKKIVLDIRKESLLEAAPWSLRSPPYGYAHITATEDRRVTTALVPCPYESHVVIAIFRLKEMGRKAGAIAKILNDQRLFYRTRCYLGKKTKWTSRTVTKILSDPIYQGSDSKHPSFLPVPKLKT